MNYHNGITSREPENFKGNIFRLLCERTTGTVYRNLYEYILSVAEKVKETRCFYTFDLAEILWRIELWKQKMPNIRPFFAVKTNSDPVLLKLLVLLGFSFDCASEGEIQYVLEAGGDPGKIIFAHVIKTPAALQYASSVGVKWMTFDSKQELQKIHRYYPEAKLLLRIAAEDVECSFDLSCKFGCEVDEAAEVLRFARTLDLNIKGVSFHVGGLCTNPKSYEATICASRRVFDVAKELGFDFTMLDIGGGFLGSKESEGLFHEVSKVIQSALKEKFADSGVEIIAEPGTYFTCSAVTLSTAVCGKKERNSHLKTINGTNPIRRFYYVNDSVYGSFFKDVEFYGFLLKPLLSEEELHKRPAYNSSVWGQTCCSLDLLVKEQLLPDLEEGEFIVWENMGAYSQVLCSTFCGFQLPASRYVFINNRRLGLEWLSNAEEVLNFLNETCSLVEE